MDLEYFKVREERRLKTVRNMRKYGLHASEVCILEEEGVL